MSTSSKRRFDDADFPHGFEFLRRDCKNVCTWFEARGIHADVDDLYTTLMRTVPQV